MMQEIRTKKIISIFIALVMLFTVASPVLADDQGPVSGSFKLNTIPQITDLNIYTDSSLTTVASSLQPRQTYWIKVSVSVTDTLSDFGVIRLFMFYGASGKPDVSQIGYQSVNPSTLEKIEWARVFPDEINSSFTGSTWQVVEDSAHPLPTDSQVAAGTEITSFDFVFKVTIGKLAKETADPTSNRWHIWAIVSDGSSSNGNMEIFNRSGVYGLPMNWYGEISIPTGTRLDWPLAKAGLDFTDSVAAARPMVDGSVIGISYTSNGDYAEGIKVASNNLKWKTSLDNQVTLKNTHNDAVDTFSLLGTRGTVTDILEQGKSILDDSTTRVFSSDGVITMSGDSEGYYYINNYRIYLSLSDRITYPGTYNGAVNFVIMNR